MSRIAKAPVNLPSGVEVAISGQRVEVKGPRGALNFDLHAMVAVAQDESSLSFSPRNKSKPAMAQTGTARALVANMVTGVSEGFVRKLTLIGVGYRAQMQGNSLNLALGYSHPVEFEPPQGVTIETPSQTEVVIQGVDKQKVGQVAAVIRGFRPPEPYKGKGVRYSDEEVIRKEAKKK